VGTDFDISLEPLRGVRGVGYVSKQLIIARLCTAPQEMDKTALSDLIATRFQT
jgi:hypothetical protein